MGSFKSFVSKVSQPHTLIKQNTSKRQKRAHYLNLQRRQFRRGGIIDGYAGFIGYPDTLVLIQETGDVLKEIVVVTQADAVRTFGLII